jgi:hypothetical protein
VTNRENILRGVGLPAISAARTHCIHGHEYTAENTIVERDRRRCRVCKIEAGRRTYARRGEVYRARLNEKRMLYGRTLLRLADLDR